MGIRQRLADHLKRNGVTRCERIAAAFGDQERWSLEPVRDPTEVMDPPESVGSPPEFDPLDVDNDPED